MRTPIVRLAGALVAAACLAGCGASDGASGTVTAAANPNSTPLVQQREAYGLPDCAPASERVAPVVGGLPDVAFPCLGSNQLMNLSQLRGRPMVVNLWAQWCEPCRQEAPLLEAFANQAGDKVRVIGVNYNDPKPRDALEFAWIAGWNYEHVVDQKFMLAGRLQVGGIPLTLFVAPDGRIVYRHAGVLTSETQLAELTKQYLGVSV